MKRVEPLKPNCKAVFEPGIKQQTRIRYVKQPTVKGEEDFERRKKAPKEEDFNLLQEKALKGKSQECYGVK